MEEQVSMPEPPILLPALPQSTPSGPPAAEERREAALRRFRRRLMALVAAGGAAFALTTWLLVRFENPLARLGAGESPAGVVKAQLEALKRGELRAAYELFSREYRRRVPFEAYRELVVTHRRMFRTREVRFSSREETGERATLETHTLTESGERYVARFTLARAEGRWWIDDLRWGAEANAGNLVAV